MEIVTDEHLEKIKKESIMNDPGYANYRERKQMTNMTRTKAGERLDDPSVRDRKLNHDRIEDSIKRLTSPPRRFQIAEAQIRENMAQNEDLVFSIKMNKSEYETYLTSRNQFKNEHPEDVM